MSDILERPLVTSIGEGAGIGPDIALLHVHAALNGPIRPSASTVFLADPDHLAARARILGLSVPFRVLGDGDPLPAGNDGGFTEAMVIKPLAGKMHGGPGSPERTDAAAIVEAITLGVDLVRAGQASGLVTLPINKKSLYDSGFDHPGHTEFLAALAREKWRLADTPLSVMMIAGPALKTVPVTIHIPLRDVPDALNAALIEKTGRIVAGDLAMRFGLARPRLAIAGLNPHAGEGGALGHEDGTIIAPAIAALQASGIDCVGPLPADTMFHAAARARYDVALCMYHDQALIPAKALGFDDAVNVTLGLPFIRTSPDHGTAFDIAGTGKASTSSFVAALDMAAAMAVAESKAG